MRGRVFDGREIEADYWDGHTDYKRVKESEEEYERRKGEFGDWIEMQGIPEELRTRRQVNPDHYEGEQDDERQGDNEREDQDGRENEAEGEGSNFDGNGQEDNREDKD